jgi:hypothetical protein
MKKTNKKLLDKYPFFHFKDEKEFETFLRTKYEKGSEKIDYVDIAGILYTMEEFDMCGRYITYYNKRTGLGFQLETRDRYSKTGFTDAKVDEPYEVGCYRNDISFID